METVKVYSPIEDKKIKSDINVSPIWKNAIHEDDINDEHKKGGTMFEYTMKFDGFKPVQVTNVKKLVK